MDVSYKGERVRKLCERASVAQKRLGEAGAKRLARRVKEIESADELADLLAGPGAWHPLKGNLKGMYSATVTGKDRIVIEPLEDGWTIAVLDVGEAYEH